MSQKLPPSFTEAKYGQRSVEMRHFAEEGGIATASLWLQVRDESGVHALRYIPHKDVKTGAYHSVHIATPEGKYAVKIAPTQAGSLEVLGGFSTTEDGLGGVLGREEAVRVLSDNLSIVYMLHNMAEEHVPRKHARLHENLAKYISGLQTARIGEATLNSLADHIEKDPTYKAMFKDSD